MLFDAILSPECRFGFKKYVELIHDLDIAEEVTVSTEATDDVPVYMNKHFAENITIKGAGSLTFKMATDSSRDYKVSGDGFVVNNIKPEKTTGTTGSDKYVWLTTTGTGTVEVNASTDNVWHTGTAGTVKVVACEYANTDRTKGYHLGTDKDGAATVTKVSTVELTAGNLEIGGCTTVETLTAKGTSAKVWGKKNSVVNVYKYDTTALNTKGGAATALASSNANARAVFKEIVLDGNGGKNETAVKSYVYGIEGIDVVLPKNVFKFGDIAQLSWNTKNDGTGTFYGNLYNSDKYPTTESVDASGNHLYAVLDKHPVGGTIFFIRCSNLKAAEGGESDVLTGNDEGEVSVDGITYTFYDTDGKVLDLSDKEYQLKTYFFELADNTDTKHPIKLASLPAYEPETYTLLEGLATAKYYTVSKKPAQDYFFVYKNDDLLYIYYGMQNNSPRLAGLDVDMGLGDGKKLRDIALNEVNKPTAINTQHAAGVSGTITYDTAWAYVDWLNGGKDDTGSSPVDYPASGLNWSGRSRIEGCSDWFIPSLVELACLYKAPAGYSNFDIGKYMMSANSIVNNGSNIFGWHQGTTYRHFYSGFPYEGGWSGVTVMRSF